MLYLYLEVNVNIIKLANNQTICLYLGNENYDNIRFTKNSSINIV